MKQKRQNRRTTRRQRAKGTRQTGQIKIRHDLLQFEKQKRSVQFTSSERVPIHIFE